MEYLAEKYGKGKLLLDGLKGRALIRQFLSFEATTIDKAIGDILVSLLGINLSSIRNIFSALTLQTLHYE